MYDEMFLKKKQIVMFKKMCRNTKVALYSVWLTILRMQFLRKKPKSVSLFELVLQLCYYNLNSLTLIY